MINIEDIIDTSLTKREILIDSLIEYSGDEYETSDDYISLAKKDISELTEELQSVFDYFVGQDEENWYDEDSRTEEIRAILQYLIVRKD